ncbi:hypothetical protein [Roseomonas chloroacetimidivorans]|uniref:hypothetical protein n=1 Tax=Roseomonas chloroacetimidivorans TaxID=1766656 RepID=UPI003C7493A0
MDVSEWRVLAYLGIYPSGTNAQIYNLIGMDKAPVSRSLSLLETNGLLHVKAVSGRSVELPLIAKERQIYERMLEQALVREEARLNGFDYSERALLVALLHRLLQNIPAVNTVG